MLVNHYYAQNYAGIMWTTLGAGDDESEMGELRLGD